jgi:hypothetical protein
MADQQDSAEAGPYVGMPVGPVSFTITDDTLADYYGGLELLAPATSDVVPTMLANNADLTTQASFANGFGNLWLRQEWTCSQPLRPGLQYTAAGEVVEIYERRERTVVVTETVLRTPEGEAAVVQRHHQSFLLGQEEGKVDLRDPKRKEGAKTFSVPVGEAIEGSAHDVSLEMCGQFFHGARNYHTDKEASEELGFSDVVVGGKLTMSYLGELMSAHFPNWETSGRMLVKFTNIVWPGETVRARGVITGPTEDDPSRTGVFGWVEKADGTVAIVAEASVAS